jgi:hypothetical protein
VLLEAAEATATAEAMRTVLENFIVMVLRQKAVAN